MYTRFIIISVKIRLVYKNLYVFVHIRVIKFIIHTLFIYNRLLLTNLGEFVMNRRFLHLLGEIKAREILGGQATADQDSTLY